jgi:hypothetical protein
MPQNPVRLNTINMARPLSQAALPLDGAYLVEIFSPSGSGIPRYRVSISALLASSLGLFVTVATPASGGVVVMQENEQALFVNTAELAELTIRLPPAVVGRPPVEICFAASVDELTILDAAGDPIATAPTSAFGPGAAIQMRYVSDTIGWVYWK